jgi:hypothetical protein
VANLGVGSGLRIALGQRLCGWQQHATAQRGFRCSYYRLKLARELAPRWFRTSRSPLTCRRGRWIILRSSNSPSISLFA